MSGPRSQPPPPGPPSPDERHETRRAVRLIAACAAVAVLIYAVLAGSMTDDAYLTRLGRTKEVHFVQRDVRELDRAAVAGDAPVTWIVGSSITREAFDAEAIAAQLAAAGSAHRVLKFAFNRGAPVFSKPVLDDLPVRPGDRVVTTLSEDNFRADWLGNTGRYSLYVQSLLSPDEILALREESLATRIEWSLASVPPSAYARNREAWRRGVVRELDWLIGVRSRGKPWTNVKYQPYTDAARSQARPRTRGWVFPAEDLRLEPGQPNFDALAELIDSAESRGATVIVAYVPGRPQLYDALDPSIVTRFHDHFDAALPAFHRLTPRIAAAYQDLKHPNNLGRPGFSAELADILLRDEGIEPAPRGPDPVVSPRAPSMERVWQGVGR
jgi:hypothetical protein